MNHNPNGPSPLVGLGTIIVTVFTLVYILLSIWR